MKNHSCIFFLLLNLPFCSSFPQSSTATDDSTDTMYKEGVELMLQDIDTDSEDSDFMDYLDDLRRNPLDLNKASTDQLTSVPLVTPLIARRIIDYRKVHSVFSSKRELLKIDGINDQLYDLISPFFIAKRMDIASSKSDKKVNQKKKFSAEFRSFFIQDLLPKRGFTNGKYEGPRFRNASRLRTIFNAGNYTIRSGIATDKDPGEKSYTDFVSGYVNLQSNGLIRSITAGDYQLAFGSGLTLSNSYSSPKSLESSSGSMRSRNIYPYSSTGEYSFFRGAVINIQLSGINTFAFFSKRSLDASVDTVTNEVRSIYADGYHRTQSEVSRKNALSETVYGARAELGLENFTIGSMYRYSAYSLPFSSDTVKKLYGMSGAKSSAAGIDFRYRLGSLNTFAEASLSHTGSIAVYGGLNFSAGSAAEVMFSIRRFPYDFSPVHNSSFGERSTSENETGFFAGIRLTPLKKLTFTSYFDQYSFPYKTFSNATPTRGSDFVFAGDYKTAGGIILNLRFKAESKEESGKILDELGKSVTKIIVREQKNIRAGFSFGKKAFRIRSRYEYCFVSYEGFANSGKGQLMFTDFASEITDGLDISARVIFFHTNGYDSRIYEFENDISGVMTNLALYGKGMRWYLIARADPLPGISLEAKYSETFYSGAKKIGSGNDEIIGDMINRLSVSLEAKF